MRYDIDSDISIGILVVSGRCNICSIYVQSGDIVQIGYIYALPQPLRLDKK